MTLSRTRSIGVDPFFSLVTEQRCDLHLVRMTSDEFFAREHPLAHFDEPVIDLAFIDGMHLAEYALRDFVNVERFAHPASVIVIDDMLPRNVGEADRGPARGAISRAWTGDVYKILPSMRALRPDLVCFEVDTTPTGTVVVLNPDAGARALADAVGELVEAYVELPDPQPVPDSVLQRSEAVDPVRLLELPLWVELKALRALDAETARPRVRAAIEASGLLGLSPALA